MSNDKHGLPRTSAGEWVLWSSLCLALSGLLLWSLRGTEFSLGKLWSGLPQLAEFFSRMTPPDWSVREVLVTASLETLKTTIAGTFLGALFAFPLGLLAASNWTPRWVCLPVKGALALIRSVPLLLLALLFVSAVGLGLFPGVLALALHSIGVLGRYVAEEIENTDPRPLRAIEGTGASSLQVLQHGLVPQVLPQMVAHLAIRFEMNLRESTVLGLVGAGGLGFYVLLYTRSFMLPKAAALLLVIVGMVVAGELVTWQVRKRLL